MNWKKVLISLLAVIAAIFLVWAIKSAITYFIVVSITVKMAILGNIVKYAVILIISGGAFYIIFGLICNLVLTTADAVEGFANWIKK